MLDNGMNIARFDFTDGQLADHNKNYDILQSAMKSRPNLDCAVMVDLKGAGFRTAFVKEGMPIEFKKGYKFKIVHDPLYEGDLSCIGVNQPLPVEVDQMVYFAEGQFVTEVNDITDDYVEMKCHNDFVMGNNVSIQLPGVYTDNPVLTKEDVEIINEFVLKRDVDFISLPGIKEVEDVTKLNEAL